MCLCTERYKGFQILQVVVQRRARNRKGQRGRTPTPVFIGKQIPEGSFTPDSSSTGEPVALDGAELEALRLVDLEGLSQEEAGTKMGVSRGTVWRLLQEARRKIATALSEGRRIDIKPE
ncbi:TPA: DUF134 domain-containing protein [Candidatus Bathyarchaeota archaeon]|nr:DUF134 domain-containing protein [Candidatus Bathyarchaeota archaeon]